MELLELVAQQASGPPTWAPTSRSARPPWRLRPPSRGHHGSRLSCPRCRFASVRGRPPALWTWGSLRWPWRASMLEGKAVVGATDMPPEMQRRCLRLASEALDEARDVTECKRMASYMRSIVVGANFGCYVTHAAATFIFFSIGQLAFLIFKVGPSQPPGIA
eukprot:SM000066S20421  [mRNA]  locus=s66:284732:285892:+ [translate_table: standard]